MASTTSKTLGFPNISKLEGWFWSTAIVFLISNIFIYYYKDYFGVAPVWDRGTQMALIGAIMTQIAIIPTGHTASLTFFGQKQEIIWGDGISPLPNFFHITLGLFHFSVLWGLLLWKEHLHEHAYKDNYIRGDVQKATFGYRSQVSPIHMSLIQLLTWFFTGWREGLPHLWVSNLGFRIMLIGIVISFGGAGAHKVSANVGTKISNFVAQNAVSSNSNKAVANIQLNKGRLPIMPTAEYFIPQSKMKMVRIDGDDRDYFMYDTPSTGEMSSVVILRQMCVLVPFDKEKKIFTSFRPVVAINMQLMVSYKEKGSVIRHLPWLEKTWYTFSRTNINSLPPRDSTASWLYLYESWNEVETEPFPLIVKAALKEESHSENEGGLVCF